ncbi:MAG TPA: amidohydrolase family protein [Stellaceae bacterium]
MEEIRHAFEILGLAGVNMQCFCGARSAADPLFEPIYAELDRRGAVLFLHPCINGLCSRFVTDWRLEAAAGPPLEDTLIAIHYMATAIPSRYSNLKIVIPHLGGSLAVLLERPTTNCPRPSTWPSRRAVPRGGCGTTAAVMDRCRLSRRPSQPSARRACWWEATIPFSAPTSPTPARSASWGKRD